MRAVFLDRDGVLNRAIVRATSDLAKLNDLVRRELELDDVRICTHDDDDVWHCRKPKPGLLTKAAEDFGIDLSRAV